MKVGCKGVFVTRTCFRDDIVGSPTVWLTYFLDAHKYPLPNGSNDQPQHIGFYMEK